MVTASPISVCVIHPSTATRLLVSRLLNQGTAFQCVDTAALMLEGLAKLMIHQPDVVLLAGAMPDVDIVWALQAIRRCCPVPVVLACDRGRQPIDSLEPYRAYGVHGAIALPARRDAAELAHWRYALRSQLRAAVRGDTPAPVPWCFSPRATRPLPVHAAAVRAETAALPCDRELAPTGWWLDLEFAWPPIADNG